MLIQRIDWMATAAVGRSCLRCAAHLKAKPLKCDSTRGVCGGVSQMHMTERLGSQLLTYPAVILRPALRLEVRLARLDLVVVCRAWPGSLNPQHIPRKSLSFA